MQQDFHAVRGRAVGARAFLCALFLSLGGCDARGPTAPAPRGADPATEPTPDDVRAFFVLNSGVLDNAAWPSNYVCYRLFVCDPILPEADLQQARADLPKAVFLAYANAQSVRIHMHDDPYWVALTAVFDSALAIRDLDRNEMVRLDGNVPSFIMGQSSAEVLAAFHRDVTMATSWDGIYVDQCNLQYPRGKRDRLVAEHPRFDIDADGLADSPASVDVIYETWMPYFLARLREEIGDEAILLGNSGGPLGNSALNGITLENVGSRFTVEAAREWLLQQRAVSRDPRLGVLWAMNRLSWQPSESLAAEFPGVLVGDLTPRCQRDDFGFEHRD